MSRVRVKICGVTRVADALAAANAGADAVGLVFYADSPRAIGVDQACEISVALPPFVMRVALFLEPAAAEVDAVIGALRPHVLQFHGRESAAFCQGFGLPYLKALPMGESVEAALTMAREHRAAQGFLLDGNGAGSAGGRGETFDWRAEIGLPARPLIVAGGLNAANVAAAIRRFQPYAVDVSSGVENSPGVKDADRMRAFIHAVQQAQAQCESTPAQALTC